MCKPIKAGLALLMILCLFLAPAVLADDGEGVTHSLIEWVQDILDDVFGTDAPDEDDDDDGLPDLGPVVDPAG
ncbi:MAG: hypothetical protein AAGF23_16025 [Acidobacteriota bacterium]